MSHKALFFLLIPFLLTSCFKTAEEIRREKMMQDRLEQSSKMIAELSSEVNYLKSTLASTTGQILEIDHKQKINQEEQEASLQQILGQLQAQVALLTKQNNEQKNQLIKLESKVNKQTSFIKKATKALGANISSGSKASNAKLKKANRSFEKGKKKTAKKLYLEVLEEGNINAAQRNAVFYNVGLLYYWEKNYDEALVYFSKIYTKYPRSSYAPRSLYYIGKSFNDAGKKDEAQATFQELIKNYPKSKQAKKAKKELK